SIDSETVFFFHAEDGIRDATVTGVQTCALPIYRIQLEPEYGATLEPAQRLGIDNCAGRRGPCGNHHLAVNLHRTSDGRRKCLSWLTDFRTNALSEANRDHRAGRHVQRLSSWLGLLAFGLFRAARSILVV